MTSALPLPPLGGRAASDWDAPLPLRQPDPGWWTMALGDVEAVPPRTAIAAKRMGITTVEDLLTQLPTRHEQYGAGQAIAEVTPGEEATISGTLVSIAVRPTRRRSLRIVSARIEDDTGAMDAVWFNQDYLARVLEAGDLLLLRGKVSADAVARASRSKPTRSLGVGGIGRPAHDWARPGVSG